MLRVAAVRAQIAIIPACFRPVEYCTLHAHHSVTKVAQLKISFAQVIAIAYRSEIYFCLVANGSITEQASCHYFAPSYASPIPTEAATKPAYIDQ